MAEIKLIKERLSVVPNWLVFIESGSNVVDSSLVGSFRKYILSRWEMRQCWVTLWLVCEFFDADVEILVVIFDHLVYFTRVLQISFSQHAAFTMSAVINHSECEIVVLDRVDWQLATLALSLECSFCNDRFIHSERHDVIPVKEISVPLDTELEKLESHHHPNADHKYYEVYNYDDKGTVHKCSSNEVRLGQA